MTGIIRNRFWVLLKEKERREGRKISLRQAAHESGITFPTLSWWKNQKVTQFSGDVLVRLCEYLGCEVGELLVWERPSPLPLSLAGRGEERDPEGLEDEGDEV